MSSSFLSTRKFCNRGGGEIIDGLMKVVGIKMKRLEGKITHSQYVRVNLVDCEHPFFGRVWHVVHILDASSPLLTNTAKEKIRENGGSWPDNWFERHDKIRRKLDFQSLVRTSQSCRFVIQNILPASNSFVFVGLGCHRCWRF